MKKNIDNKKSAFSLIELSIVLIIIGLLVAGVTSGQSLIESAKVRSFLNELRGFQTMLFTFQASNGKLPGDVNNDGIIGICDGSGCPYNKETSSTKFGGEYSGKEVAYQAGPWVDLYIEGISDFKPVVGDNLAEAKYGYANIKQNTPYLNSQKEMFVNVFRTFSNYSIDIEADNFYGIEDGLWLSFIFSPIDGNADKSTRSVPASFMQKADLKSDDGDYQGGILRTCCYGTGNNDSCINTYQTAIDNNKTCDEFIYKLY